MTAAVRKKDEELTINLKCIIGVLMTNSGLLHNYAWRHVSGVRCFHLPACALCSRADTR